MPLPRCCRAGNLAAPSWLPSCFSCSLRASAAAIYKPERQCILTVQTAPSWQTCRHVNMSTVAVCGMSKIQIQETGMHPAVCPLSTAGCSCDSTHNTGCSVWPFLLQDQQCSRHKPRHRCGGNKHYLPQTMSTSSSKTITSYCRSYSTDSGDPIVRWQSAQIPLA